MGKPPRKGPPLGSTSNGLVQVPVITFFIYMPKMSSLLFKRVRNASFRGKMGGDNVTMWSSFCIPSFTKSSLLDSLGLIREMTEDKHGRMDSRILFDQLRIGAY